MTIDQVIAVLRQAGFRGIGLVDALATVMAENGKLDPSSIHANNDPNVTPPAYLGSLDVGLFQINTTAHPQYTTAQLQDPLTNAQAAFEISQGGTNFGQWSTWTVGLAESLIGAATAAILGSGGSTGTTVTQTAGVSAQTAAQSPISDVYQSFAPPAQATSVISGLNATASSITSEANAITTIPTAIATAVASVERIFWVVIGLVIGLAGLWLLVQSR